MRGKKILATLALSAVLFTGCGLKSQDAIIIINGTKITQAQFDDMFDKQASSPMLKAMGVDIKSDKNAFIYNIIKERVINELIVKTLIEQEAQKRSIKVTDKDIDEAIKEIIDKLGSKEALDEALKQNGITTAQFRKDLKTEVKMKKLAQSLGSSDVSDAEAKKFYDTNKDKFKMPERVRASHILISANPEEITEIVKSEPNNAKLDDAAIKAKVNAEIKSREAKAQTLLAEVKKNPKDFAKLAKENSEDPGSAKQGGDLGFFAAADMVPEFSKAAFSMKPNTISDKPVKTQYGYHIIMVTDRAAASTEKFDKVKDNIKAYISNQKQVELVDNLVESLKKTAEIKYVNEEYNPDNVQKGIQDLVKEQAKEANKRISE